MVIFYDYLNVAVINALCIYKYNHTKNIKIKINWFFTKHVMTSSWKLKKLQIKLRFIIETLSVELWKHAKILFSDKNMVIKKRNSIDPEVDIIIVDEHVTKIHQNMVF